MISIQLKDSYKIHTSKEMCEILNELQSQGKDNGIIALRGCQSLINEWKGHNLLYDLHLYRSHTKDVDFEYPQDSRFRIIWSILAPIYSLFH